MSNAIGDGCGAAPPGIPSTLRRRSRGLGSIQSLRTGMKHCAASLLRAGGWLGALLGRAGRPESDGGDEALSMLAHELRTPLCAIRSSAEILRDHPDMDPDERTLLLEALLAEEARLESLLLSMLEASSLDPGRRTWRVPVEDLALEDRNRAARAA